MGGESGVGNKEPSGMGRNIPRPPAFLFQMEHNKLLCTRYHLQTKGPIFSTREKRSQQKPSLKQLAKMQTIKI